MKNKFGYCICIFILTLFLSACTLEGQEKLEQFKPTAFPGTPIHVEYNIATGDTQPTETLEIPEIVLPDNTSETTEENSILVPDGLLPAELIYVVDGDTLYVSVSGTEKKVRLIGINTPESVHEDESQNNEFGIMASNYTKDLLNNVSTVYLEYDVSAQDQYGRDLCYVWLETDTTDLNNQLNAIIIRDGYAEELCLEPNVKYANEYDWYERHAIENSKGLWQLEEFHTLTGK